MSPNSPEHNTAAPSAAMAQSLHQLFLLSDHIKLSLLERQRAITLDLEPHKQDAHISRSLEQLREGLEALEADQAPSANDDLSGLRAQCSDLSAQFRGEEPPSTNLTYPNDASLQPDFAAARSRPSNPRSSSLRKQRQASEANKSVRFRDEPDAQENANRAALFQDQQRYRDEPDAPDHADLDNTQIHTYHKQVIREQDEQLNVLGQSIGRQRMLGIQMGDELDEQNELLTDVESGVDRHVSTLERARKRLGNVARKSKDNWSWVTIGILICVLVLLIIVLK